MDNLPGLYQEDLLARPLTEAFDEVLAPVIGTIDNFSAYLDPALTPEDFLDWLAGWVGLLPDENWPILTTSRNRRVRCAAVSQQRHGQWLGDAREAVCRWRGRDRRKRWRLHGRQLLTPRSRAKPISASLSGSSRLREGSVDVDRLNALVAAAKPAHVPHSIEIVEG